MSLEHDLARYTTAQPNRMEALKAVTIATLAMTTHVRRQMIAQRYGASHFEVPDFRYSCTEEFVLFNATGKESIITNCPLPAMKPGNCFANAMLLTLDNPELIYVEGWATMEQGFPTHHAWVEAPDGSVIDPTWLPIMQRALSDPDAKLAPDFRARCYYMGVRVPLDNHLAWFASHETPNILAFGEMMPEEILTLGAEALAEKVHPEDREFAIAQVRKELTEAPQWELAEDGSCFMRERPDNTHETWSGKGYVM